MWGPLPQNMSNALTAVKGVLSDAGKALGDAVGGIKKKAVDTAQNAAADAKKMAADAAADAKKKTESAAQDTIADVKNRASAAGDKISAISDKAKEEIGKKAQE